MTDSPLVNSLKSQQGLCRSSKVLDIKGFALYKRSVSVLKGFTSPLYEHVRGDRGEINAFSDSSRKNLRFKCLNTHVKFQSQFCLTYQNNAPRDGIELKRQLNNFLTFVRKTHGFKYLWILEFQTRKVPHFHIFFDCEVTPLVHLSLAQFWNKETGESEEHLRFHLHPRNFCSWEFDRGGYLQKYLEKEYQKHVPDNFINVGRFWGSSRGIVAAPHVYDSGVLRKGHERLFDESTGEIVDHPKENIKFMYRCLRKHQESKVNYLRKQLKKAGKILSTGRKYKSSIARITDCLLMDARNVFEQVSSYIGKNYAHVPF